MIYFRPTFSLKDARRQKFLHNSFCDLFRAKLKILGDIGKNDRFHHNCFIFEIGPSERLRLIFGTKIFEIGSCEWAFTSTSNTLSSRVTLDSVLFTHFTTVPLYLSDTTF